jgi:hypothetical protein
MIEQLLQKFAEMGIAIQITLDINKKPTVHAITIKGLKYVEGDTLIEALQNMDKLVEELEEQQGE